MKTALSMKLLYIITLAMLPGCTEPPEPWAEFPELPESEEFDANLGTWSEDGTRILFQHTAAPDGDIPQQDQLWIADPATGEREKVFHGPSLNPDWHPGGDLLVFHTPTIPASIWTYSIEQDSLHKLTGDGSVNEDNDLRHTVRGRWSPDGEQIVFMTASATERSGVTLMNKDGSKADILIQFSILPNWSPDGKQISYVYNDSDEPFELGRQIHLYDMQTGDSRQLTEQENPATISSPVISPDRSRIAFVDVPVPGQGYELYVMEITGENIRRKTQISGDVRRPEWHPDGNKILFTTRRIPDTGPTIRRLYIYDLTNDTIEPVFPADR